MRADREKWDQRYRQHPDLGGDRPSALVVRWAQHLTGPVLDLAGGTGRNALYVARLGLPVVVVDISREALHLLHRVVRAEQLPVRLVQADLEDFPLPEEQFGTILNIRYLQRSLFPAIKKAVRPGGLVLVETFLMEQQMLGHPRNPEHLLHRGELSTVFADFQTLEEQEGLLKDNGPAYLARLVARRPQP